MSNLVLKLKQWDKSGLMEGLKMGLPVAIGYIPIAIAFGVLAKSSGIPDYITLWMSFLIFAGASQFIGVNLIAAGVPYVEILITTFILNFRHFLMSASLSQRLPKNASKTQLAILSYGVTDETFSVASTSTEKTLNPRVILGLNTAAFASWNIGTWSGVFLAAGLPPIIQDSMGIALYSMFIGLLIPSLAKSKSVSAVAAIAILISSALYWIVPLFIDLSPGWNIIIATVVSAFIGAMLFPGEGDPHE